jgi:hypothetical protein
VRPALHYVGFRGDEYRRAVRLFGPPDFIHIDWDHRAKQAMSDGDTAVFARGTCDDAPAAYGSELRGAVDGVRHDDG